MGSPYGFLKSFENLKSRITSFKLIPRPPKKKPSRYDNLQEKENRLYGYTLLSIPIGTFCLGTWQIERRQWKLKLLERMRRIDLEPQELPDDLHELKSLEYVPVKVKGTFLYDQEITMGPRSLIADNMGLNEKDQSAVSSTAGRGYWIITPFKLEGRDLTILVNRGWVSEQFKDRSKRSDKIEGVQEITGVIRLSEKKPFFVPNNKPKENMWYYRNVQEIADVTGADPVLIDLAHSTEKKGTPIGGQTRVALRNEHFSYILTWYSLSIATGYLWYRQFIVKLPLF